MKIIYISRHKMTPAQRKTLREMMGGKKHKIIQVNPPSLTYADVKGIIDTYGKDAMYICPGSIHIVASFLRCGVKPYHFLMIRKHASTDGAITTYECAGLEQIRYLRVNAVKVL